MLKNRKGFTIIEVFIVICIIACMIGLICKVKKEMDQRRELEEVDTEIIYLTPEQENSPGVYLKLKCIDGYQCVLKDDKIFYIGNKDEWDDIKAVKCEE